jgi:type II secretory pathway pseudopilin PulG
MRTRICTKRQYSGFTLVELMVVIGILIILMSILIPSISSAFASARSRQDSVQQRGIYQAMTSYATSNDGKFPLPSTIVDEKLPDPRLNTTSALMSWLIMQRFIDYTTTVSPVETNPNIRVIEVADGAHDSTFPYNYDIYGELNVTDGDLYTDVYYWDPDFNADFTQDTAHSSYAHQALVGQRLRLKWRTGTSATNVVLCNRGPEIDDILSSLDVVNPNTYTYGFHGSTNQWQGAAVMGDGTTRMLNSVMPDDITYAPLDGSLLRSDILFETEFGDVDLSNPEASGDNWIIVTSNVNGGYTANNTTPVWD